MTQILLAHSAKVQQMRNLTIVAQGAVLERNAAVKQLGGLKELTYELHRTRQDVSHYKDRANQYEMSLLRVEAHLKKTKNALWEKQTSLSEVMDRLQSLEAKKTQNTRLESDEQMVMDVSDSSELETDSAPIMDGAVPFMRQQQLQAHPKVIDMQERGIQVTPSPCDVAASVPREKHDDVLREVVRLKFIVQDLAHKQGLHYKQIIQASEYEDQIKQLREELQDKTGELQHLKQNIYKAKTSKDAASQLMETQLKLEKVMKANDMKQVLNETMSRHIDELTHLYNDAKKQLSQQQQQELLCSSHQSSIEEKKPSRDEDKKPSPVGHQMKQPSDETDSGKSVTKQPKDVETSKAQPLRADVEQQTSKCDSTVAQPINNASTTTIESQTDPITEKRPQWEQSEKEMIMEQQLKHFREKVERMSKDCNRLLTEKIKAIRDREVYETRYNNLMETVMQTKSNQATSACSECRSYGQAIKKQQDEMQKMSSEIEMLTAQKKMFEDDLEQEQLDTEQKKERFKSQIESWRKNCVTLSKQVNLYKGDLEKERKKIKNLEQKLAVQQQATQMIRTGSGGPYFTMQPGLSATSGPRSCAAEIGPLINPWQEGYSVYPARGQLVTDGETVDEYDGDGQSQFESALSTVQGKESKNECPRCKREFGVHDQEEYRRHIDICMDNS